MNRKTIEALTLFTLFILVLTGLDYVVHGDLYNYGLQFNIEWANKYWILYAFTYQIICASMFLHTRSWKVLVFTEAFVLTCTQDLVYFMVWGGGHFPVGDWTWMPFYNLLGTWTTAMQIILSCTAIATCLIGFKVSKKAFANK